MVYLKKEYEIARKLRAQGKSILVIEKQVPVARSTLSLWLRNIPLTKIQRDRLIQNKYKALKNARKKAELWHRGQKAARLKLAKDQARETLSKVDLKDNSILELAMAMLYLGEGFKKSDATALGNSDPAVLKIFVNVLARCYNVSAATLNCELHLRFDQSAPREKKYWSAQLGIPIERFKYVAFDARTKNSKTYTHYHGVCTVRASSVAIQRKLINIGKQFTEALIVRA